jgi:hypothetical protein
MRRILGLIGLLWGGAVLVNTFILQNGPKSSGPFAAGERTAIIFAILMVLVGSHALLGRKSAKAR